MPCVDFKKLSHSKSSTQQKKVSPCKSLFSVSLVHTIPNLIDYLICKKLTKSASTQKFWLAFVAGEQ